MIEKIYEYNTGCEKTVEKLIMDDNIHMIHMIFQKGDGLPEHYSNSNVYMTVVKGRLTIQLNEQSAHHYEKGHILKIPKEVKMNVSNQDDEVLELFVVKAPAPTK